MARGTVKDPEGHQSGPYEFGYIQRDDLGWPDGKGGQLEERKVIPFFNRTDDNSKLFEVKNLGQPVNFEYRRAHIIYQGKVLGSIGIAVDISPTN